MRAVIRSTRADEPSAAMVHNSCPSRAVDDRRDDGPSGDHAGWRKFASSRPLAAQRIVLGPERPPVPRRDRRQPIRSASGIRPRELSDCPDSTRCSESAPRRGGKSRRARRRPGGRAESALRNTPSSVRPATARPPDRGNRPVRTGGPSQPSDEPAAVAVAITTRADCNRGTTAASTRTMQRDAAPIIGRRSE